MRLPSFWRSATLVVAIGAAGAAQAADGPAPLLLLGAPLGMARHPSWVDYHLAPFPDGSVGVEVVVHANSSGQSSRQDESWLVHLDRKGWVSGRMRLPILAREDARATMGLADGSILFVRSDNRTAFLAVVDPAGRVAWDDNLATPRTYRYALLSPVSNGFAVLNESAALGTGDSGGAFAPHLDAFDSQGRQLWQRPFGAFERSAIGFVLHPDGGHLAYVNGASELLRAGSAKDLSAVDGQLYRVDADGMVSWRRSLEAYLLRVVGFKDGGSAYAGIAHADLAGVGRLLSAPQGEANNERLQAARFSSEPWFVARLNSSGGVLWRCNAASLGLEPAQQPELEGLLALPGGDLLVVHIFFDQETRRHRLEATRLGADGLPRWRRLLIDNPKRFGAFPRLREAALLGDRSVVFVVTDWNDATGQVESVRVLPLD